MSDIVFLFPGQGSQYVGMGRQLWERFDIVKRRFEEASDITGKDLRTLCFGGPDTVLLQTDNVQPAITLVSLACLEVIREHGISPVAAAGHSLGEYAALCAAGVLSFADTIRLVHVRGQAMRDAATANAGGMRAVFGLDYESLAQICIDAAEVGSVEIANVNSPTQIVITGEHGALARAAELAKARGAKLVIPLKVSGPWHSRFMRAASDVMRATLHEAVMDVPAIPVVANVSGMAYPPDANAIREGLIAQIVSPVLWSDSVRRLIADGHRSFVEVGPGKVLAGLMKDIDRGVAIASVQDEASLEQLDRVAHATPLASAPA